MQRRKHLLSDKILFARKGAALPVVERPELDYPVRESFSTPNYSTMALVSMALCTIYNDHGRSSHSFRRAMKQSSCQVFKRHLV
ncbi:hypothetical protein D5086_014563 [Populus alba]|uniref:Uncharacterized protein n=1 Tax=Populus alba TaxID=43335 RepID=A0ACC4BYE7_POPAL